MKKLTGNQTRQMFLDYFKSKGHMIEPGASLIPHNDPTLLWINAGVAALKKYFDEKEKPASHRIANAQKSIRTNDIENVGKTARHHTFFEMLGNFSIGDYFKREAIHFAWEFLTGEDWIAMDKDKLYVTVYTDDEEAYHRAWKWANQARESAAWYQHEDIGYNYRMSNVIAGVVRGQFPYLQEHIAQKKAIYERYKEGFKDLPVTMNPIDFENSEPNYWLSCLLINKDAMCRQERGEYKAEFWEEPGKSCPTEILTKLSELNAEGRPIWKPMHMQPLFDHNDFISLGEDVGADIFNRGLCLPSDNKMTPEIQDKIIEIVKSCFD